MFAAAASLVADSADPPRNNCSSRCFRRACSDCFVCCALLGNSAVDATDNALCCQELSCLHASARLFKSMLGIGIRTLAPYAPDKLTYARVATNDGSIALFRQSLASSRACLCETRFPRRIRASSRRKVKVKVDATPAPSRDRVTNGNEDDLNAPSRACNTPAPRRSKRPTCDREPRPRTRVKPVRRFPRRGRACVSRRSRERGDRPRGARGGAIEGRENRRQRPRVPRARR